MPNWTNGGGRVSHAKLNYSILCVDRWTPPNTFPSWHTIQKRHAARHTHSHASQAQNTSYYISARLFIIDIDAVSFERQISHKVKITNPKA